MECDFCHTEKPVILTGASYEYAPRVEPRQTAQDMFWCRTCYVDEWDCKTFMYSSPEEAGKYWDKKAEIQNKND